MEIIVIVLAGIALVVTAGSFAAVHRVKGRLAEMAEALEDIKRGNGNRRMLAGTHELTAPVTYAVNDIVRDYENRLAVLHRAEETNRQLMTSLSHDVRTPLTTLIGYLDAVHKGTVTGREGKEYIETARRKAYDLKEYIDVLFDWFRLNSDEFTMDIQKTEAAELTRNVLIDWVPVLEDKGIDLEADIPGGPFYIHIDTDCYSRILNNLIQNIIAHSRADRIEVRMSPNEGALRLQLSDNGVGIGKEDLKHIFERLYKCDKGRSEKGSGLGLSIAHQLMEKMGGSIAVSSVQGEGTTFYLEFPLNLK